MSKPITAADLRASATDERWAAAMLRCRSAGPYCGADGYCHLGDCFTPEAPAASHEAHQLELIREELGEIRGMLIDMRALMRQLVESSKRGKMPARKPRLSK